MPGVVGCGMYALATAILVSAALQPDSASIVASVHAIASAAAARRAADRPRARARPENTIAFALA